VRILILLISFILILPLSAAAEKRLGLVIGNDAYSDVPQLRKAVADATSVSAALDSLGYEVITVLDAPRREMNRRISEFTGRLEPGDMAFVFFAGHGVEIDGENYLLPTDIVTPATGERDFVKSESIALSRLLDRVRATGARTTVAVIDACRNNPFPTANGRSIGGTRGLGRISAPEGTFVIFSAGAGQLALDELTDADPASNSVFTRALLPRITQPGLELREMIAGLRTEVRDLARTVNHQQFPAYYDELLGDFYFAGASGDAPAPAPQQVAALEDPMRADFDLARSVGTPEALEAFLERYSDRSDEFSYGMARQLLESQTANTRTPASKPTPEPTPKREPEPVTPIVITNAREMIRATQAALNDAGCRAGIADGIVGKRTRQAFSRFIADSGADLVAGDLGSQKALNTVAAAGSGTCKVVVAAAPAPAPKATPGTGSTATETPTPAADTALSLAGRWKFKATCALLLKVTGTISYTKAGSNYYSGRLTDSLGQQANSEVYLNGTNISGTSYFPGVTDKWHGRLAADGKSYTGAGSTGCTFYVWRVG